MIQLKHIGLFILGIIEARDVPVSLAQNNHAVRNGAAIILLGNKGKTNDDNLLIGSVAEQLIASDSTCRFNCLELRWFWQMFYRFAPESFSFKKLKKPWKRI